MAKIVGAAARVPGIHGNTSARQSHGLRRSGVILQGPEHRVGVVQIAGARKGTRAIATQVVPKGVQTATAVPTGIVRENAVL